MISDRTTATLRALLPIGVLEATKTHAHGGKDWTISRPAGTDGVNAPSAPSVPDPIVGYAISPSAMTTGSTQSGTTIPIDKWRLYADDDQGVQAGDKITNVEDSALKFYVQSKEQQIGYVVCVLEPTT